ncbi:uncharacterized protein Z520_07412 [Fonsecaea multimorphosa CBS 102226]|uniref:Uncharacterized protein n=1 Tax=Fonsecaea multimorphosa CBS 102226 TaxID=1442371 RepID=A0A0D2KJA9_9EURO|nr:uncharacterized protein Z520_07412 [Fonsecaea multimorphosa CBS 102226]KIX96693.1 hypothetical protein Z520_07412 [Fonsecaea multimorphosa CBS 102226]OAL22748.1 hypothetical protein AYO22_06930 [Fonsecaea multimorphosa]
MDDETLLKYELAEIEFDKRQLQLERRELEVKRRLEQLKRTVDLTEDSASSTEDVVVVKSEAEPVGTDKTPTSTQDRSSAELQTDATVAFSAPEDPTVGSVETTATQELQKELDKSGSEKGTPPRTQFGLHQGSSPEEARLEQEMKRGQSSVYDPESASQRRSPESHEDLLAAFTGRPPAHSMKVTHTRKQRRRADDLFVRSESGTEAEVSDSTGGPGIRAKRRRMSQKDEKQPVDDSAPMTESQKYDLVQHYTQLLLKHMAAVESDLPDYSQKPTVVSKMRRNTNGKAHHTLSLLHDEFEECIKTNAKNKKLRQILSEELKKFREVQRWWWPKCQALSKQQERTSFLFKVFRDIVENRFKIEDCMMTTD